MKGQFMTGADGSAVYVTIDGDMIDAIAHAYYGKHARNTEALLEANWHVVYLGPVLPAGTVIKLPQIATTAQPATFRRLWD
ncbi:tail X family protein [Rhizobium sp. CF080]|uniref:tail protein X n=1 Tax=Rhizobium sp. (strain CF080) TaxID=1144310 RepID=UPI000271B4B4|nr:tail protein X [Rhizobium sp. CF080]EUB97319.1 tail X family protein [Rhizobium sp. CF080]